MLKLIERLFPRLRGARYQVTSPRTKKYNCIAWALADTENWWEPSEATFWPDSVPRLHSLSVYRQILAKAGYAACDSADLAAGFEKVAIFADDTGEPTHVARQLATGRWTSKLGKLQDIEHNLHDLEGDAYGTVALILKRPNPPTA